MNLSIGDKVSTVIFEWNVFSGTYISRYICGTIMDKFSNSSRISYLDSRFLINAIAVRDEEITKIADEEYEHYCNLINSSNYCEVM